MPLRPRTIPSRASEPIERDLIDTTSTIGIDPQPEARSPSDHFDHREAWRMVIRVCRKPSDHRPSRNVSGSAVRDRGRPRDTV